MSAAHTPGPWTEVPQNGAGPMIAHQYETGKQLNPVGLRLIAHILTRGNSREQDKANAALIAAAPDLLAACEALVDARDGLVSGIADRTDAAAALARAAVAKAGAA